jgi:TRAP-type C4-dicarboxylate transport system substrate-binding protein
MKTTLLAAATAVALACNSGLASAQDVKIVYANYLNPKHTTNPVLVDFFKKVEKDTGGKVTFEYHFASSLLSGKDIPGGVRSGVADSGYFVGAYVPSEMPVDNFIGDFSFLNDDALMMTGVNNELVILKCPECSDEYEKKFKTKFLATYALTSYVYHCKTEVRTLADMKGKKVRGISGYADLARGMGAVPLNVNADEAYEALDRGVIDCALHSITSQKSRSYGEAAKFVITDSLGGFLGASLFNLRLEKWNQLSKEQRDAIVRNIPELVTRSVFNYIREDEEVLEEYAKKGTKFYKAESDLAKFITEFRESYTPKAIEKGKQRRVKDAEEIARTITELRAKWTKLLAENGRDPATFQKLLWQEIYSKIKT